MAVITFRQALHDTLRDEMLRDENVVLMGEEIGVFEGSYKITAGLLQEFGEKRIRDTPIAEEGFVGAAVGAAMLGLRPVVEIMTINFSILAMDQIINNAAKIHGMFGGQASVPLVIRTPGGGGQQLSATHSQNLEVWYAHTPGLKVVAPATAYDAKGLIKSAVRDNNPVIFLEHKYLYRRIKEDLPEKDYTVPLGKARLAREVKSGGHLSIITYAAMVHVALEAAEALAAEGIEAEILDIYVHDAAASLAASETLLAEAERGAVNRPELARVRAMLNIAVQLDRLDQRDRARAMLEALLARDPHAPLDAIARARQLRRAWTSP